MALTDQIEFTDLDGGKINIMLLKDPSDHSRSVSTPEWVIKVDELLESSYKDFTQYTELLGYEFCIGRETKEHVSGSLNSSGVVQHSDIYAVLYVEASMPKILVKLYQGATVREIKMVRLSNVQEERQKIQEINFRTCHIDWMKQVSNDLFVFRFRAVTREDIVYKYTQDGTKQGQTNAIFNFSEGKSIGV